MTSERRLIQAAWLLGVLYILLIGPWCYLRVTRGTMSLFDLMVYHTALRETFNGHFYFTYLYPVGNLLYMHFDPILPLLALPFYAVMDNHAWMILIALQLVAAALVFPGLARIARQEALPGIWTLAIPALLLLNSVMHNAIWYDFHPLIFAMPLLVWGYAFQREQHPWAGHVCWGLAMLCKENIPLTVGGLALVLALRGQVKRGAAWILGAIFSFVLITAVLIPSFRTIGSGSAFLGTFYGWLGDTPFEILKTLLTRPVHVVETVLSEHQGATWLRKMMLPLGMLFLLAPEFLLALLPEAAVLLLSSLWMMRSTLWHYPSISLCVLAIGAVGGLGRLHRWATAPTGHPAVLRLASIGWRLRLIPMAIAVLLSVHYLYQDGCTFPFLK